MAQQLNLVSDRIRVADSVEAVNRLFYGRGWTDGLPIIPPSEDRVRNMLQGAKGDAQEVIALIPPKWGEATLEKIAVNAVMAGCLPEYMPVIVAAIQAMSREEFNLYGVQATTHPCAPLIIVSGPITRELDINSGYNAFGQGRRSNAAIGRAIRLILMNIGGGTPGGLDRSTQGSPTKYSYCVAENEDSSPWEPLNLEKGFSPGQSMVTVVAAEGPHNVNDHASTSGEGILTTIAGTIGVPGNNNVTYTAGEPVIALGPEHAATIANDGFSKDKIKGFIFEKSRVPMTKLSVENREEKRKARQRFGELDENAMLPICRTKDDIIVIVVGGAGKHSCCIPTFGLSHAVTKAIGE